MIELTARITAGLECSNVLLMPFLRDDLEREQELLAIGVEMRLATKVIRPQQRNERYACVMFERVEQPQLI